MSEASSRKAYKLLDVPATNPTDPSPSSSAASGRDTVTSNTRLVNASRATKVGAFHCSTCDATFTSYDAYLDHVNSRIHQRNSGTQGVERVDDPVRIRERLALLRERRTAREHQRRRLAEDPVVAIQERIEQRQRQEEAERRRQQELCQQQKKQTKPIEAKESLPTEEAALMASVLGITSFK